MKFSVALTAAIAGFATASPTLYKRTDYTTVVADIKVLAADLTTLNNSVNAFQSGGIDIIGALTVYNDGTQVNNDIQKTTSDVNASPPFGKKGSNKVAKQVLGLQAPIASSLQNIINKKPEFDHAILGVISVSSLVLSQLQALKNSTDALGAAIVPKLSASLQSIAPQIIAQIDQGFDAAIAAYSASS